MQTPRTARLWLRILTALAIAACVAVFALMLQQFGSDAVAESLHALDDVWLWLALLEMARIACEVVATRALLGADAVHLSFVRLVRGQLLGQMLDVVMPAGRTSAEAAKALLYSRVIGAPQAAAIATALQLGVLSANALWVLVGFVVSSHYGLPRTLRTGLLAYSTITCALVLAVALFPVFERVRRACARFPMLHQSLEKFARLMVTSPIRLASAVLAQLSGRCMQTLQLMIAAHALGAAPTLDQLQLTEALYLVGAALGELVPAQLGTTDAVFVAAAPSVGLTPVLAFTATLALHAVQVVVALGSGLGSVVLWSYESRRAAASGENAEVAKVGVPEAGE